MIKEIYIWIRVIFIRLPKEIFRKLEELYWVEKLR